MNKHNVLAAVIIIITNASNNEGVSRQAKGTDTQTETLKITFTFTLASSQVNTRLLG